MKLDAQNADAAISRLFAWRNKADAAGRGEDAELIDAVIAFLRQHYPHSESAAIPHLRGDSLVGQAVQAGAAECCPHSQSGACVTCLVDRTRLFSLGTHPGRSFACLTLWSQALMRSGYGFQALTSPADAPRK